MHLFYPRKKSIFKNDYMPRCFDVLGYFVIELHQKIFHPSCLAVKAIEKD